MIGRIVGVVAMVVLAALLIWRLDVNGWGSLLWAGSGIATSVIRSPHEARNKQNTIARQDRQGIERVLLIGVMLGGSVIPLVHLLTGVFSFADYDLPWWATALSLLLVIPGLWLFHRSHTDLGRNWSVTTELRDDHTLVASGVYERIRHPMYSAIWLIFLAYPLMIHNWIAGFAVIVAFGAMYVIRVPYEEAMMVDRFGDEYRTYAEETGRLVPPLR